MGNPLAMIKAIPKTEHEDESVEGTLRMVGGLLCNLPKDDRNFHHSRASCVPISVSKRFARRAVVEYQGKDHGGSTRGKAR